jgi:hypothetical protein
MSLPLLALLMGCSGSKDPTPDPVLSILSTSPEDGARDVDVDVTIRVTFDGDVNPELLTGTTLFLAPATVGVYAWDEASRTASFDPGTSLQPGTPYRLRVTTGLGLPEDEEILFSTAVDDDAPPPDATVPFGDELVTVFIDDPDADTRTYTLTTTQPLRDSLPPGNTRTFTEAADAPRLRSGDPLFDALFAMAMTEVDECRVSAISDGAFNDGAGVPCTCFETGEKWKYVWTRDTAYAVDLALGLIDPQRARNSLKFKLSRPKAGGPLEIVQDTGSGGSWPVSTDRAVWALGARAVLDSLSGTERDAFAADAVEALATTIATDRRYVYDPASGLYNGEQSFLDWREQSYPAWTAGDVTALAEGQALSTNAAHHALLRLAAELGDAADHPDAATWAAWADDLAVAMRAGFLRPDGTFSSLRLAPWQPSALPHYDQLGLALTVLQGIATPEQALTALSAYPHTPIGPPVIWPQRPDTAIYHNRAVWPFVTAYGLLAAKQAGHDDLFDHDLRSLVRGAALNLSNMENLEFLTGRPWVDAGAESGPVVNSRRQLWSVAGYLGAVIRGVFGVETGSDGLTIAPFVTPTTHTAWLSEEDEVTLHDLTWRGRRFDVVLHLPTPGSSSDRAYEVDKLQVDGADHTGPIGEEDLASGSQIDVWLTDSERRSVPTVELVEDDGEFRRFWPPKDPSAPSLTRAGAGVQVTWPTTGESGHTWSVWRDGVRIADSLTSPSWTDVAANPDGRSACYAITATWTSTGLESMPSPSICWWGSAYERIQSWDAWWLTATGSGPTWSDAGGRAHYVDWGAGDHTLTLDALRPWWTGRYALQLDYANGAGPINTGITTGHKVVTVEEVDTGRVVASGSVIMPHSGGWDRWNESTLLPVDLDAGVTYRVTVSDGPNMTRLEHFRPYTGGLGGGASPFHFVDVAAIKLLPLDGDDQTPDTGAAVALDGADDIDAYAAAQVLRAPALGLPLQPWEAFALDWDDDWLYVTIVAQAFEEDFTPFFLYLEADPTGPAAPSDGVAYSFGTVTSPSELPFTATHVVALRAVGGAGPQGGPWPGLWRREAGGDVQLVRFAPGRELFVATDRHTISARVPLAPLGHPSRLRVAGHAVWGAAGDEWKDVVPATHTPWASGGGWYELDLTGPRAATGWDLLP